MKNQVEFDPELLDGVLEIKHKTGVTNVRQDPTQYTTFKIRVLEGHPLLDVSITVQECFGAIVAHVYHGGREMLFVSECVNEHLYPGIEKLFWKLWEAENPAPDPGHADIVDLPDWGEWYENEAPPADFFDDVREGGHLPADKDFDELMEVE